MFLLGYEFDKGCSLLLSTPPGLLLPICANNVAIESRVQYMIPLPARHVSDDWTGEKKLGQSRGAIYGMAALAMAMPCHNKREER